MDWIPFILKETLVVSSYSIHVVIYDMCSSTVLGPIYMVFNTIIQYSILSFLSTLGQPFHMVVQFSHSTL